MFMNKYSIISLELSNDIKAQTDINTLKMWNKISARSNSIEEFISEIVKI